MAKIIRTKAKIQNKLKLPQLLVSALLIASQPACALGFGEMQVNSFLGEPLRAQVDLSDLGNTYEGDLKVRLASPDDYRKYGYVYPYDSKYKFTVANDSGKQAMVRVVSSRSIDDPFLNLLLEVSTPTGKVIRSFTLLIDPPPDVLNKQAVPAQAIESAPRDAAPVRTTTAVTAPTTRLAEPVAATHKTSHTVHHRSSDAKQSTAHADKRYVKKLATEATPAGKLSLSLSTSLSISNNDPSTTNSDTLQEELIAKEKTLKEMNDQIVEMNTLIKTLQARLNLTASSAISASGVLDSSMVAAVSGGLPISSVIAPSAITAPAKIKIATPIVVEQKSLLDGIFTTLKNYYKELSALLLLGLLGGAYWYRKHKLESGWIPPGSLFDDLDHPAETVSSSSEVLVGSVSESAPVVVKKLDIGSQSIKVPAYKEPNKPQQPEMPAEYDLLEEADIYLRFGHDKLAEEVLRDALKINPKNPEIYLTLLGIFDTRGDAAGFATEAKQLQSLGDNAAWEKVLEMGRKLDPDNSLYA